MPPPNVGKGQSESPRLRSGELAPDKRGRRNELVSQDRESGSHSFRAGQLIEPESERGWCSGAEGNVHGLRGRKVEFIGQLAAGRDEP